MASQRPLRIIVCVQHDATRLRCLQSLHDLELNGRLASAMPRYAITIVDDPNPEKVFEALRTHLQTSRDHAAILVSDLLAEAAGAFPNQEFQPTSWAKDVLLTFEDRLLGTIAILERYTTVSEVERVLRRDFDPKSLLDTLQLSADRLSYIAPADAQASQRPVAIRPIATQAELQEYFRLRHRVYRVMGYLEQKVEFAPSGMEIDWCDTTALHVGAFEKDGPRQKLVGTARIVSIEPLERRYAEWTRNLAHYDHVLRQRLDTDVYPLGLPIFHSMRLDEKKLADVFTEQQNVGELSRVIVTEAHRGTGLYAALVKFALAQAVSKGVSWLLLECLPRHEPIYRKFGFRRIDGAKGRVIGVNKTMIGMELGSFEIEQLPQSALFRRPLQIIKEQSCLCVCPQLDCHRGEYVYYTNREKCPLRRENQFR